ncbi:MAG: hypothetical protein S4CHLAM45_04320 [Chlamydiales bacterium]|nr:hypothetical protein [Chlamydiales bacterium]MCH9619286.1 hypothetical protein [Chlamydiales bacterium]MCH9622548.1 hypothetical protein [Chlamydiales bacterium]
MKYFFLFISLLVFHSSLLFSESLNDLGLPQDLIYDDKPIDPKALLNACYHEEKIDFSKLTEDVKEQESQAKKPQIKVLERKLIYDQKKVAYQEYFQVRMTPPESEEAVYEGEYINHFSYDYLGSAGNKHILKTMQYDTSGHGNDIHTLLILTKNTDGVLSLNTVTAGYHWEGFFNVHSFANNYLTYSQIRFPCDFMDHLLSRGEDDGLVACCSSTSIIPFEVLYEYDLENFKHKISGLMIPGNEYIRDEFNWDFESNHQEGNFFVWALNEVLKEYNEEGKTQLNFEEACIFAEKVVNKIDLAKKEFLAQFESYQFNNCSLPNDLLYQGKPVHPDILCNASEGLFSPIKTYSCSLESPGLKVEGNYVESEYCYPGWGIGTYTIYSSYSYIASYGNKHVLELWHWDLAGTGRFCSLGVFERLSEKQMKVHWLAGGDRFNGVVVGEPELNDSILSYRRYHTPDWILKHFAEYDTDVIYPANGPDLVEVLYEADLKGEELKVIGLALPPAYEEEKQPKAIGLTVPPVFEEDVSCFSESYYAGPVLERMFLSDCYYSVEKRYSDRNEKILSSNEAQAFASEIIQELKSSRDGYMKKIDEWRATVEKNTQSKIDNNS